MWRLTPQRSRSVLHKEPAIQPCVGALALFDRERVPQLAGSLVDEPLRHAQRGIAGVGLAGEFLVIAGTEGVGSGLKVGPRRDPGENVVLVAPVEKARKRRSGNV